MKQSKFYYCKQCKNLFNVFHDSDVVPMCCGEEMTLLVPNTVDAAGEKHLPHLTRDGAALQVQVGSVLHPMLEEHHIEWIMVQQGNHIQRMLLTPGMDPIASFVLSSASEPIMVYEYCNLHGIWSTEG